MIRQMEGRAKPKMPPKSDLRPEEIADASRLGRRRRHYSPARRVPLDEKVPTITTDGVVAGRGPLGGLQP